MSHHFQTSRAPNDGGSAAHAALSLELCNSVVTVLITPEAIHLLPNRRQGDPASLKGRSPEPRLSPPIGRLVSITPLATEHKSRLHQLAGDAALQPQAAEPQAMGFAVRACASPTAITDDSSLDGVTATRRSGSLSTKAGI